MNNEKYVLKEAIKNRILASHELIGKIADRSFNNKGEKLEYQTIRARLINNSPILTSYQSELIIRQVLNLKQDTEIFECVKIGSPELHHE